jgi:glyoxylase-like metal-dependent hydrolase (beta-lactamase superfamily II)
MMGSPKALGSVRQRRRNGLLHGASDGDVNGRLTRQGARDVEDFTSSLIGLSWRLPLAGARQLTKLALTPARSLPGSGGALGSAAAAVESGVDKLFSATEVAAGQIQDQTLDLLRSAVTLRPLRDALQQSFSFFGPEPQIGSQKQPELEYLKAVNDAGPSSEFLNILVLAVQYSAVNRQEEGVRTFEGYLRDYATRMHTWQQGVYLSCLALLLAGQAQVTPIWKLLDLLALARRALATAAQAKQVTANLPDFTENQAKITTRWVSGLLNAQLPPPLGDRAIAFDDLEWVSATLTATVERQAQAYMFLRESWFQLARLYRAAGKQAKAEEYLRLSTYTSFEPQPILIATLFACDRSGLRDGIKAVSVSGDGHVFTVSGMDMSEFNYVISKDRRHLVAIDGGTRWQTNEAAYEYLRGYLAQQGITPPPLTTVIFTHAHWDHIGGQAFYRKLNPAVRFYARDDYRVEQEQVVFLPPPYQWFLSTEFNLQPVADYRPEVLIGPDTPAGSAAVTIGGTRFEFKLIRGGGGETVDGMFVYLPEYETLYAGDFIVPWIGSPYNPEGDVDSLLASIDWITEIKPRLVLHGHEALSLFFPDWRPLAQFRPHLAWLQQETLRLVGEHRSRQEIQEMNLYPQALLHPDQAPVQFVYILFREHVINRAFFQYTGYWGGRLRDVDYLTEREIGSLFSRYLQLSPEQIAVAVNTMMANGDHELACRTANWALTQYPDSPVLIEARRKGFLMLKQKWQMVNVFKFVMYSETIANPTPQLPLGETPQGYVLRFPGEE